MKITSVRARPSISILKSSAEPQRAQELRKARAWLTETVIANPMSWFPKYAERRSSWLARFGEVVIKIETDEGVTGFGLAYGGESTAAIIEQHLAQFLIGEDPANIELLWEQMYRASMPYGRKGLPVMAISGVDIALWDLVAKAKGEPLYRLIGGKTKDRLATYVTGNNVEETKDMGFLGFKLAMPYGPAHGLEGIEKNVAHVARARETVGEHAELMLDCYMAWDVEYTIRMAKLVEPYRVRWIEESLPPDDIEGYSELVRKISSTTIATGEHEYTRYGHKELLVRRAAGVLQPDVNWVGGITETLKIAHMASAFNVPVIPHAGGIQPWAVHVMISQMNCPFAETIASAQGVILDGGIWRSAHRFEGGYIYVSDEPGVGLIIDPEVAALI